MGSTRLRRSRDTTTLLGLSTAADLTAWTTSYQDSAKGRGVPRSLWDVLTFDGARYRSEGWSAVPGTRLVRYVFSQPPFRRSVLPVLRDRSLYRPTVARFAIRSAVLPKMQEAIAVTERLRTSIMSQSKRVTGGARPVFSGHGEGESNHQHAMYLATSEDPAKRGFIDYLTITAKAGFDEPDIVALQQVRRLWGRSGHDLELILVGLGQASDFGGLDSPRASALAEMVSERTSPMRHAAPLATHGHAFPRGAHLASRDRPEYQAKTRAVLGVERGRRNRRGDRIQRASRRRCRRGPHRARLSQTETANELRTRRGRRGEQLASIERGLVEGSRSVGLNFSSWPGFCQPTASPARHNRTATGDLMTAQDELEALDPEFPEAGEPGSDAASARAKPLPLRLPLVPPAPPSEFASPNRLASSSEPPLP